MGEEEKSVGSPELASFEGKYPRDLFNKSVVANGQTIGYVAKETKDMITVFGDSNQSRFDIPKSKIEVSGGSVLVDAAILHDFRVDKDAPLPQDSSSSLRPSAEKIREATRAVEQGTRAQIQPTRADAVIREGMELATNPRESTVNVSIPSGYAKDQDDKFVRQLKKAARELKETFVAGTKIANQKAWETKRQVDIKYTEADAEKIARMGQLALNLAGSFEAALSEIESMAYADQDWVYAGFLKLIDSQRDLVVARKGFAARLKGSATGPAVVKEKRLNEEAPVEDTGSSTEAEGEEPEVYAYLPSGETFEADDSEEPGIA